MNTVSGGICNLLKNPLMQPMGVPSRHNSQKMQRGGKNRLLFLLSESYFKITILPSLILIQYLMNTEFVNYHHRNALKAFHEGMLVAEEKLTKSQSSDSIETAKVL